MKTTATLSCIAAATSDMDAGDFVHARLTRLPFLSVDPVHDENRACYTGGNDRPHYLDVGFPRYPKGARVRRRRSSRGETPGTQAYVDDTLNTTDRDRL